ncbi:MAG: hypothetical protein OEX07_09295, partial [Gammaproteobacteria bacterium]|nr:hypothetical protein [Gammaproteobacteria bacterium]
MSDDDAVLNETDLTDELDDEFNDAWDEDEEAVNADDEFEEETDLEAAQADKAPVDKDVETDDIGDQKSEVADEETDPDKVKQELKTWQGRRDLAKKEALKLEEDLETNRSKLEQLTTIQEHRDGGGSDDDLSEEDQELLDGVKEDYPNLTKAIE